MKSLATALTLLALLLSGCAASGGYWDKPGASVADFERDKAQCLYEAEAAIQVPRYGYYNTQFALELDMAFRRRSLAISCLKAKGWKHLTEEEVKDY